MPIPYNISQSPVPVGISGTPTGATQRQAYSWSPTVTGGFGVRSFTMTGNLPERMTFNPFTGTIAGIPRHVISVSGLSITVTDASGSATLSNLTIPVASAISNLMITGTPDAATVGSAYTFTPTVTGGSGPRTYSFSGRLEDGLLFSPATGAISGTPTEDGGSFFIITVQDSVDSATLSGTVVASYPGGGVVPVTVPSVPWTPAMVGVVALYSVASSAMLNGSGTAAQPGDAVQSISDLSGTGKTITAPSSTERPSLALDADSLNSPTGVRPIKFRTTHVMFNTTPLGLDTYSIVALARLRGGDGTTTRFLVGSSNNNGIYPVLQSSAGTPGAVRALTDTSVNLEVSTAERMRTITVTRGLTGAGNGRGSLRGSEALSTVTGAATNSFNAFYPTIGNRSSGGYTTGADMDLFGIAFCPQLNRSNQQRMEAWLAWENGLQANDDVLAPGHPYKTQRPMVPLGTTSTAAWYDVNVALTRQTYMGGYIEIQPDSFNGGATTVPPTDATTDIWGFPYSLTTSERARIKAEAFPGGGKRLKYLRFPLGFAYRGFRNIDGTSGLAKNIGPRYAGQNQAITDLLANVVNEGGGLMPEYWAPPPHWTVNSAYAGSTANPNALWAGGANARSVTLDSIRTTQASQYAAQIAAFTDAIINDLEYLHANVAPVRGFGLQNEPVFGQAGYGTCSYSDQLYSDVLTALVPKIRSSAALSTYGGVANTVLIHINSDDSTAFGTAYIAANPSEIWSYTYHKISQIGADADWIKSNVPALITGNRTSYWANEVEYFTDPPSDDYQCANNMLRDVENFTYGQAPVTMPIIHLLKQLGQTSAESNTKGYGLFKMRLPDPFGEAPSTPGDSDPSIGYGQFAPVVPNYNSWLLFGDNVPVGSVRLSTLNLANPAGTNTAAFRTPAGKLGILAVNRTASPVDFTLPLGKDRTMRRKRYNMTSLGVVLGDTTASAVTITVPAYSGEVLIEQ